MILCREAWIVLGFMDGWLAVNIHFEGKLISVTTCILFVFILLYWFICINTFIFVVYVYDY